MASSFSMPDVLAAVTLLAGPILYLCESGGYLHLQYSKFANSKSSWSLPSRWGMFMFYAPVCLITPLAILPDRPTSPQIVMTALISLHFFKRCIECLFLHRFSGVTSLWTILTVSGLYKIGAYLFVVKMGQGGNLPIGFVLFVVGELGNFYHHLLMRRLRDDGSLAYKIPSGGLFAHVCCPHYLFEIITWIGLAVIAGHLHALAWVLASILYLAGRSTATLAWYQNKDMRTPRSWRRLVPFLF